MYYNYYKIELLENHIIIRNIYIQLESVLQLLNPILNPMKGKFVKWSCWDSYVCVTRFGFVKQRDSTSFSIKMYWYL